MEKEQVIKELQKNAEAIVKNLLPNALNKGEDSKYKNLINGLSSTLDLIDRYSWRTMWSKYRDKSGKQFVSIWEQDINGNIRNNIQFKIDESKNDEYFKEHNLVACGVSSCVFTDLKTKKKYINEYVKEIKQDDLFVVILPFSSSYLIKNRKYDIDVNVLYSNLNSGGNILKTIKIQNAKLNKINYGSIKNSSDVPDSVIYDFKLKNKVII